MKKHNFLFIGECVIVVALLVLIGVLAKDEKRNVQGKESVAAVVEVEDDILEASGFLQKLLTKQEEVAEEDVTAEDKKAEVVEEIVAVEEIEDLEADIGVASAADVVSVENAVSDNDITSVEEEIQIVVFGDSIWNAARGIDGISEQVMEQLDVEIHNCSIGGTTAAVDGESTKHDEWTSRSFNGMMYIANDIVKASDLIAEDAAYDVITKVDFEKVDYIIVSYGLNDYFSDIPVYPKDYYDLTSYVGALRHGINKLQKKYRYGRIKGIKKRGL